jgi:hypothetical protein
VSIMIREYMGYEGFEVEYNYSGPKHIKEGLHDEEPLSPNSLMVDIEGIHVGPTRNFTRYMKSALQSSEKSWTHPYEKPLIMHHNEKDGRIIGRVKGVRYTEKNTRSGTGALVFTTNVPDKDGMEQVEDGRLQTVSIGIIGHDVRCSSCGHNIAEQGPCEHERGQIYDGEVCYWDIYEMEGKELSYVIVPSDIYAKNIRIYKPTRQTHISENLNLQEGVLTLNLTEAEITKMQEDFRALKESSDTFEATKSALETELQEAKDAATKATSDLETLQKTEPEAVTALKSEKATLETTLGDVKAQEDLATATASLSQEKSLRESLETQSIEQNSTTKQVLVENYTLLRKLSGKSNVATETIQERTKESLSDAIKDLKEEMGDLVNLATIQQIADPTITESAGDDVNKAKKTSNIDLEEGLHSLFDNVAKNFTK